MLIKPDPWNLSFMEPGWWVLHAMAISPSIFLLGQYAAKKNVITNHNNWRGG